MLLSPRNTMGLSVDSVNVAQPHQQRVGGGSRRFWPVPFRYTVLLLLVAQNTVSVVLLRVLKTPGAVPVHSGFHLLVQELLKIAVSVLLLRLESSSIHATWEKVAAAFSSLNSFGRLCGKIPAFSHAAFARALSVSLQYPLFCTSPRMGQHMLPQAACLHLYFRRFTKAKL